MKIDHLHFTRLLRIAGLPQDPKEIVGRTILITYERDKRERTLLETVGPEVHLFATVTGLVFSPAEHHLRLAVGRPLDYADVPIEYLAFQLNEDGESGQWKIVTGGKMHIQRLPVSELAVL